MIITIAQLDQAIEQAEVELYALYERASIAIRAGRIDNAIEYLASFYSMEAAIVTAKQAEQIEVRLVALADHAAWLHSTPPTLVKQVWEVRGAGNKLQHEQASKAVH